MRHGHLFFGVKWQFPLMYLDDIVIIYKALQQHRAHNKMVLTLFNKVSVALKLKNRAFFTNRTDYLFHFIRPGRLEGTNHTADAIRKLKVLTTVIELCSFWRLCNVFIRFFPVLQGFRHRFPKELRKRKRTNSDLLTKKD